LTSQVSENYAANRDLEALIRSPLSRKSLQAPNWLSKERAEEYIIDRVLDNLTQLIPNSVIQLTIEQHLTVERISQRREYVEALENHKRVFTFELQKNNLPAFRPWVEFITRFCGIIVAKLRFEYVAEPEIAAKNVTVTLLNEHLSDVSIGCLEASIEMSMLVNKIPVKLGKIDKTLNLYHRFDEMLRPPKWTHAPKPYHGGLTETAETKFCVKCGTKILASANFCVHCGAKQDLMVIHA